MLTSAQIVETSANVITNSPSQDYTHPDDHNLPTYKTVLEHLDRFDHLSWLVHLNQFIQQDGSKQNLLKDSHCN